MVVSGPKTKKKNDEIYETVTYQQQQQQQLLTAFCTLRPCKVNNYKRAGRWKSYETSFADQKNPVNCLLTASVREIFEPRRTDGFFSHRRVDGPREESAESDYRSGSFGTTTAGARTTRSINVLRDENAACRVSHDAHISATDLC